MLRVLPLTTIGMLTLLVFNSCERVKAQGSSSGSVSLGITCQDQFKSLPALAKRLGVAPQQDGEGGTLVLLMCDGTRYELNKLITALLDRMDAASKPKRKARRVRSKRRSQLFLEPTLPGLVGYCAATNPPRCYP